jgi:hypothetical protein
MKNGLAHRPALDIYESKKVSACPELIYFVQDQGMREN